MVVKWAVVIEMGIKGWVLTWVLLLMIPNWSIVKKLADTRLGYERLFHTYPMLVPTWLILIPIPSLH
jgi:hypothetical protein